MRCQGLAWLVLRKGAPSSFDLLRAAGEREVCRDFWLVFSSDAAAQGFFSMRQGTTKYQGPCGDQRVFLLLPGRDQRCLWGKHHTVVGWCLVWRTALGAWLVSACTCLHRGGPAVSSNISLGRCQQLTPLLQAPRGSCPILGCQMFFLALHLRDLRLP